MTVTLIMATIISLFFFRKTLKSIRIRKERRNDSLFFIKIQFTL